MKKDKQVLVDVKNLTVQFGSRRHPFTAVDNASFQLFFQLGFDVLKLDKSLVWGLDTTDRTMQVICSLVRLCDDLGIETVAEGIETGEQHQALQEAGCTRVQGYRVGRPQPIEEFERRFLAT